MEATGRNGVAKVTPCERGELPKWRVRLEDGQEVSRFHQLDMACHAAMAAAGLGVYSPREAARRMGVVRE
jgi:hypothetical protein